MALRSYPEQLRYCANYVRNTGRGVIIGASYKSHWDSGIGTEYPTLEMVRLTSTLKEVYRIQVKKVTNAN